MRTSVVLIEGNPHLRTQVSEAVERMGLTLSATYDVVTATALAEIAAIAPAAVIFPIHQARADQWRLVRALQALPDPPMLMALAPLDFPAIHQNALAAGVHHIFDPLLDVERFLATLQTLAGASVSKLRQQVA